MAEPTIDPAYTDWCRGHFGFMAEGGIWAVPRSGLIFERRDGTLVLIDRMPYSKELAEAAAEGKDVPADPEELRAYQDADFLTIRLHFKEAGIMVDYLPGEEDPAERIPT